jgi:thiamine pyrophosphokinase
MPAEGAVTEPRPTVVVAGGDPVADDVLTRVAAPAFVIAADSGLHAASALGLHVDLVVGDLDSAAPEAVAAALAAGADIELHPADKDATDLELALQATLARRLHPVIVLGGASFDRVDHFMANALLLADPRFAPLQATWYVKGATVVPVHDDVEIAGGPDDVVTLLAVGGPARGVVTRGLRWELHGDTLAAGSTRGVSNEMTGTVAKISIDSGSLLAIHHGSAP